MDERVIKNLVGELDKLKRRSTRLRYGRVTAPVSATDDDPLSVTLGDAPGSFSDVRTLVPNLIRDDHVAVLVSGNDLLVLGKVI